MSDNAVFWFVWAILVFVGVLFYAALASTVHKQDVLRARVQALEEGKR